MGGKKIDIKTKDYIRRQERTKKRNQSLKGLKTKAVTSEKAEEQSSETRASEQVETFVGQACVQTRKKVSIGSHNVYDSRVRMSKKQDTNLGMRNTMVSGTESFFDGIRKAFDW